MHPAALLAVLAFAAPPWSGTPFHPYSVDPGNADCVAWSDTTIGMTHDCDPINLVFPDQDLAAVVARLHAAGWVDTTGNPQWLYEPPGLIPVGAQVMQADGPDPTQRYHVRLWQAAPGLTVGNVHHEHGEPHHIDMAWDDAESFAVRGVCAAWCGHVHLSGSDAIQGSSGMWRGFANDGDATVVPISPASTGSPPLTGSPPASAPVHARAKPRHRPGRPHPHRPG